MPLESTRNEMASRASATSLRSSLVMVNKEPYRVNLPETELLDFILKSEYTQTLSAYCSLYGVVPQRDIYKGMYIIVHFCSNLLYIITSLTRISYALKLFISNWIPFVFL